MPKTGLVEYLLEALILVVICLLVPAWIAVVIGLLVAGGICMEIRTRRREERERNLASAHGIDLSA